jgi:hypothetical protein
VGSKRKGLGKLRDGSPGEAVHRIKRTKEESENLLLELQ